MSNIEGQESIQLHNVNGDTESKPLLFHNSARSINNKSDKSHVTFLNDIGSDRSVTMGYVNDAIDKINRVLGEGTIRQSIVIGTVISCVCGIAAYAYYNFLFFFLEYIWHTVPEKYLTYFLPKDLLFLWIPIVVSIMAIGVGTSVLFLGEPGDLAYTVKCVNGKAFIGMDHVLPMLAASQFSILGGASLGPEAPLVAICASLAGFVSRNVFNQKNRNVIRKHTLMGMAGALAAFFGCPLGGSLFALEVNSRFGVEYFEHTIEAIFCGTLTVGVFRAIDGMSIHPIWEIAPEPLQSCDMKLVGIGALIGLLGAGVAFLFTLFHSFVIHQFEGAGLMEIDKPIYRAIIGSIAISTIGIFIPHILFWGEFEFEQIANASPASSLAHVFPTKGLISFEMDSCMNAFLVGMFKIIAISFSVAGGYRGGFIFPFFAAGAAFGRSILYIFPTLDAPVIILCFAAGINVAITKTCLATTIILTQLSGEGNAQAPILAASIASLFATARMPFIKTQIVREDIDESLHSRFLSLEEAKSLAGSKAGVLRTSLSSITTSNNSFEDNHNIDGGDINANADCIEAESSSSLRKLSLGSYIS